MRPTQPRDRSPAALELQDEYLLEMRARYARAFVLLGALDSLHRRAAEAGARPTFVGFDDSPLNDRLAPWLTAVRLPYADHGEAIVRALQGRSGEVVLRHELIARAG